MVAPVDVRRLRAGQPGVHAPRQRRRGDRHLVRGRHPRQAPPAWQQLSLTIGASTPLPVVAGARRRARAHARPGAVDRDPEAHDGTELEFYAPCEEAGAARRREAAAHAAARWRLLALILAVAPARADALALGRPRCLSGRAGRGAVATFGEPHADLVGVDRPAPDDEPRGVHPLLHHGIGRAWPYMSLASTSTTTSTRRCGRPTSSYHLKLVDERDPSIDSVEQGRPLPPLPGGNRTNDRAAPRPARGRRASRLVKDVHEYASGHPRVRHQGRPGDTRCTLGQRR